MRNFNYVSFRTGVSVGTTKTNSVAHIERPDNTTTYAAGDVIGEVTTNDHYAFTLSGLTEASQTIGSGVIDSARMMINSNKTAGTLPDIELWLFDTDVTEVADNSAFAPTDAEILTLVGIIDFASTSWKVGLSGADASGNIVQQVDNLGIVYKAVGQNQNAVLYGQLVLRNAYTPIASEEFHTELVLSLD